MCQAESKIWSVSVVDQKTLKNVPFAFIIYDKLENTMTIWSTELDRIFSGCIFNGRKCDADVGVEHCEF